MTGPAGWFRLAGGDALVFERASVLAAHTVAEVAPVLHEVEAATRRGFWAAGLLAYEAAPGLDPSLRTLPVGPLPPAAFLVVRAPRRERWVELTAQPVAPASLDWQPSVEETAYAARVAAVRAAIGRGDTYQVNLTWRLRAPFTGDARGLLAGLLAAQPVPHAAYLDLGRHAIACASPELFFARRGDLVVCRPMKGTSARGRYTAEDVARAAELRESAKQRAENLMIVDMVRNDLGRVARTGSVRVARLFAAERYATLWQLTSSVVARSDAPLPELMTALFPSASITGAPKASTMEIIRHLEAEPRGIYTGAVGWMGPGGRARFQVAIRTVAVDREIGVAEYGTGGGITWPSTAAEEHAESRLKARVLTAPAGPVALIETLRWTPSRGYWLLGEHLERLRDSARYLGFRGSAAAASAALERIAAELPRQPHRVRLLLAHDGAVSVEAQPLALRPRRSWRVALAAEPVDAGDRLLFHKVAERGRYEAALGARPGCDDVVLWNRDGRVTESTVANVVLELDGELVTPPLGDGLLPGVYRRRLLARGVVRERPLPVETLRRASRAWLVNSVRGWLPVELAQLHQL